MRRIYLFFCFACWLQLPLRALAQPATAPSAYFQSVHTYVNPVLPGDHPDPTMIRVGDDFYHCGSSFHFTPYLPIYHSKDMVHWEIISRVLPPALAGWVTDRPSAGIWQGAITYFYGSFWIYFSANGQWFSRASNPRGPWSTPVQVKTNPTTGPLGYDNSIFIDDDGKPYMVIKNGQRTNRLQALGRDGQLTDTVINLDWINANLQYSWAEGPVMCKRNGYYYYFPAGDVSGGQYVLRGKSLTSDSTQWERLGHFFKPITDTAVGFRRPNHISAPLQLADGSWWTIGQSYEIYGKDDWSGKGRQTSLYPVIWEGDRPWGMAPTTAPIPKPALPKGGIPWRSVSSDRFTGDTLAWSWHFLSKKDAARYSLQARKGWLRLIPDSGRTSIVQKETDHYYTAVTKLDFDAADTAARAGLYLTNGNQRVTARLFSGYDGLQKQIVFRLDTAERRMSNPFGNTVWLKISRSLHELTAYVSGDGIRWTSLGTPIRSVLLDKVQPNYNSWVGTSVGLFAEGHYADFDQFVCKDGFTAMPAVGYSNYYGVERTERAGNRAVTNHSDQGGWMMISGVEAGEKGEASRIALEVSADQPGKLELWMDDLAEGKLLAAVPVKATGGKWVTIEKVIGNLSGHHDLFIRFPTNNNHQVYLKSLQLIRKK